MGDNIKALWLLLFMVCSICGEIEGQVVYPCAGNVGVTRVPDPDDCTRYTICIDASAFPSQCSPGLIFDVVTNACNREEVSICIKELQTPPTPGPPGEATTTTAPAPTPEEPPVTPTTADPTDGEVTTVPTAPTIPTDGTTVPAAPTPTPATVQPPPAPTPAPTPAPETTAAPPAPTPAPTPGPTPAPAPDTTPAPGPSPGAPHCPPGEVFYAPHPDCTRFYRCVNGTLFELQCPPNQFWNQDRQFCDHQWNVTCPSI